MSARRPASDGPRERLRAALRHPGFTAGSVEVDGCRVHHRVAAETPGSGSQRSAGPAFVLVHGLIVSGRYMMPLALRLAAHGRVLVPDLPGFGGSEKPRRPPDVPALAALLAGYLRALDLPRVVLVANSFGCQVVAAMAARHPGVFVRPEPSEERAGGAEHVSAETSDYGGRHVSAGTSRGSAHPVSAETSPGGGAHEVSAAVSRAGAAGCIERVVLVGPTVDPAARSAPRQIARLILSAPHEPLEYPPLLAADLLRVGIPRGLATFRAALADRIEESLPSLRVPALVVRGSRDPITPRRWAEQAARLLPSGHLVEIPGGGHALNYGAAEALAAVIRDFAEGRPGGERKERRSVSCEGGMAG